MRSRNAGVWICALIGLAAGAAPGAPAHAQTAQADARTVARTLATFGKQKYDAKQYAEALKSFRQAQSYFPAPTIELYIARCHDKLGHLLDAKATYDAIVQAPLADGASVDFRNAKDSAKTELTELLARIPTIRIDVTGKIPPQSTFAIDGQPLAQSAIGTELPVSVGNHVIDISLVGKPPVQRKLKLAERARERIVVEGDVSAPIVPTATPSASVSAAPTTAPSVVAAPAGSSFWSHKPVVGPTVLAGAGLALIGLGVGTGVVSLQKTDELAAVCPNKQCPAAASDTFTTAQWTSQVSTAAFIAGGVAVAGGVAWFLWPQTSERAVTVGVGPSHVVVSGKF